MYFPVDWVPIHDRLREGRGIVVPISVLLAVVGADLRAGSDDHGRPVPGPMQRAGTHYPGRPGGLNAAWSMCSPGSGCSRWSSARCTDAWCGGRAPDDRLSPPIGRRPRSATRHRGKTVDDAARFLRNHSKPIDDAHTCIAIQGERVRSSARSVCLPGRRWPTIRLYGKWLGAVVGLGAGALVTGIDEVAHDRPGPARPTRKRAQMKPPTSRKPSAERPGTGAERKKGGDRAWWSPAMQDLGAGCPRTA